MMWIFNEIVISKKDEVRASLIFPLNFLICSFVHLRHCSGPLFVIGESILFLTWKCIKFKYLVAPIELNFCWGNLRGNSSNEETIQERKLFKRGNYMRKYCKLNLLVLKLHFTCLNVLDPEKTSVTNWKSILFLKHFE